MADELCPLVELRIRIESASFLNPELVDLQRDRDYFVKKAELTKDLGDEFIASCLKKRARNEVRIAKSRYYHNQAIRYNRDPKNFWREYYRIEPHHSDELTNICDDVDGNKIPDDQLPDRVNDYFVNIGSILADKLRLNSQAAGTAHQVPMNDKILTFKEITRWDVLFLIYDLSNYKSSGLNNISTKFFKQASTILVDYFAYMYNLVLTTGVFPNKWKTATVTLIPKVTNPKSCSDLRPISILPVPGRILEQILHRQMVNFLDETKYLTEQQFGFRHGKSTTQALASVVDDLLWGMDGGLVSVAIFVDLKKAFDTIDHSLLLDKLRLAGLDAPAIKLLSNYLSNRTQQTKISGKTSACQNIQTGVPQGSTLGPLLF